MTELWDLAPLESASRLGDWMFEQYAWAAAGDCAEVGPGIGTFSARLLDVGVDTLLLVEPDERCANLLERRFGNDQRVRVEREQLPEAQSLLAEPRGFDFVLCQNVLEHVPEHDRAVRVMAKALRPGGRLTVIVPANPALFGSLDREYGHLRRYTKRMLSKLFEDADLQLTSLYAFNALGIPGWWLKNRIAARSLGRGPLAAYEVLLAIWRPLEQRLSPEWGLSLVAHAERR